jgi:hypothetical protein
LLDGCEERGLGLLQPATARDDGRGPTLGKKLIERQAEASLAAVGGDRRGSIVRLHQRRDAGAADSFCPRLIGQLSLPTLETSRRTAALRGIRFRAQTCQYGEGNRSNLPALDHS